MADTDRSVLLRRIAERDQGDSCHYCGTPLVLPDRREELCERVPTRVSYEHCCCGEHDEVAVDPCVVPAWWRTPWGYEFAQVDHVVPTSRGGSDDPENLVLCCPSCNSSKGAKTLAEWNPTLQRRLAAA